MCHCARVNSCAPVSKYVKIIYMRMHKKSHLEERLANCGSILTTADLSQKNMKLAAMQRDLFSFACMFGNSNPVHLEVGCGKGGFVNKMALLHPEVNFVAVEKISNVMVEAVESALPLGLNNVHFLICAAEVLPRYIPEHSISRIYLNFSNPLPKLGYVRQRLTNPRFLQIYKSLLTEGGEIWQKTDDEAFFDYSLQCYGQEGFKISSVCRDLASHPFEGNVVTEHEARFMSQGKKIFRAVVQV